MRPIHTCDTVSVRSRVYKTWYSSGITPPSLVVELQRLNPEAICWSSVLPGKRSPASCSMVNRSKLRLRLKASITQSRNAHASRKLSK